MSSLGPQVAEVLFGSKINPALAEGYTLIKEEADGTDEYFPLFLVRQEDAITAASLTKARAIRTPLQAHRWLVYLERWLFTDTVNLAFPYSKTTGQAIQGIILGLFEAAVWFDQQQWQRDLDFDDMFPQLCVTMLIGKNCLQQRADATPLGSTYRGSLTNAIKAYVKGPDHGKGRRLAKAWEILREVAEHVDVEEVRGKDQLGPFSELVLDQLTFALFGQLSPYGRTVLLGQGLSSVLGLEKESTEK